MTIRVPRCMWQYHARHININSLCFTHLAKGPTRPQRQLYLLKILFLTLPEKHGDLTRKCAREPGRSRVKEPSGE